MSTSTELSSFFQVPYELLNRQFRSSQKVIDREVSKVNSAAGDLDKKMGGAAVTVGDVTSALTTMVDNLSMLKRKVSGHACLILLLLSLYCFNILMLKF